MNDKGESDSQLPDQLRILGEKEMDFGFSKTIKAMFLFLALICVFLAVAGTPFYLLSPTKQGQTKSICEGIAFAGFCLGASLIPWLIVRYLDGQKVIIFQKGIAEIWRDDVKSLAFADVMRNWEAPNWIQFYTSNGQSVHFNVKHIEDLGLLKQIVNDKLSQYVYPAMREQFARGEDLDLGDFKVSRRGMDYGGVHLPWSELDEICVILRLPGGQRELSIRDKGRSSFCRVPLHKVPNSSLLIEIIQAESGNTGQMLVRTI